MEQITLINGNKQPYTIDLPEIRMIGFINDVALAHVLENTGLDFKLCQSMNGETYSAQPTSSDQITKLLLTYDFKTRYYNNWNYKNILFLKSDHHIGFDVDSICYSCAKHNHIHTGSLMPHDRLAS